MEDNNLEFYEEIENIIAEETAETAENNAEEVEEKAKEYISKVEKDLHENPAKLVKYIAKLSNNIEGIKKEEERLKAYRQVQENKLDRFKEYVKSLMEYNDTKAIDTSYGRMSIRKSPVSAEIVDIEKVPEEYKKTKTEVTVDKKALLNKFKETGELIDGIKFNTTKTSLTIK